jgi:hypothetical protein
VEIIPSPQRIGYNPCPYSFDKEVKRLFFFDGKDSAWSRLWRDDEEKGSPPRGGVNPAAGCISLNQQTGENRKISGSPSGAPSPVFFPSEQKTLSQHCAGNCTGKTTGNGKARSQIPDAAQTHRLNSEP